MAKFEIVSKYADAGIKMPVRGTKCSAGYDFFAAEDTLIPPYEFMRDDLADYITSDAENWYDALMTPVTLDEMAAATKATRAKPTLVPTGIKAKLEPNMYLKLASRSSSPLKYWIIMANSIGVIDADYYNNPDNEGHIYFQLINLSPLPIIIKKGEAIGQGILEHYEITEDDAAAGDRMGGFGSTDKR